MPEAPFHIYRSSAGSGKTFTLSREYLKLALSRPGAFRKILGVTFTNKASEEMKRRIVDYLKDLAQGKENPMTLQLQKALKISPEVLQQKASDTLTDILHNYGRFSVVTIDSFFHQVIRSFAREMGLQGTFTIDLDLDKVMQQVIDRCMQVHGAGGLTEDYCMAEGFNYARWCRQADGPDQVHQMALGKMIINRYTQD
ncbi:MAG: UvrD-helicase domain-containing protein [Pseudomonadales bacterium]